MKQGGNLQSRGRWPVVSLIIGWCAFLALAAWMGAKRLMRRKRATPSSPLVMETAHHGVPGAPVVATAPRKPDASRAPPLSEKIRRESGEVNARRVFLVVFGWFVFVFVGLAFLMHTYKSAPPYPKPPLDSSYPMPRLIMHPFALQPPYLSAQQHALTKGPIPITRAMAKIAARANPYAPLSAGEIHGQ